MQITESKLRQLIREEIKRNIIQEGAQDILRDITPDLVNALSNYKKPIGDYIFSKPQLLNQVISLLQKAGITPQSTQPPINEGFFDDAMDTIGDFALKHNIRLDLHLGTGSGLAIGWFVALMVSAFTTAWTPALLGGAPFLFLGLLGDIISSRREELRQKTVKPWR